MPIPVKWRNARVGEEMALEVLGLKGNRTIQMNGMIEVEESENLDFSRELKETWTLG